MENGLPALAIDLAFEHPAQQIAFQDYVDAVMDAERRLAAPNYPTARRQ